MKQSRRSQRGLRELHQIVTLPRPVPKPAAIKSFLEETCYHVVMSGISDIDLNEKVLTQAMLGNVKDLRTISYHSVNGKMSQD